MQERSEVAASYSTQNTFQVEFNRGKSYESLCISYYSEHKIYTELGENKNIETRTYLCAEVA